MDKAKHKKAIKTNKTYSRSNKGRYRVLKYESKNRGLELDITFEEFDKLISNKVCHYCHGKLSETGAALDRKNNSKGYLKSNVVPCCKHCNMIKSDKLTYKEAKLVLGLLRLLRNK